MGEGLHGETRSRAGSVADGSQSDLMYTCPCNRDAICNLVLGYLVCALKKGPRELVKKTALGHFTSDAIHEAKAVLWSSDECAAVIGPLKVRKGSHSKPRHEFEIEDLLDAMIVMDESSVHPAIHVPALELDRMPPLNPAALLPVVFMDKMKEIEAKMEAMQASMVMVQDENLTLKRRVDVLDRTPQPPPLQAFANNIPLRTQVKASYVDDRPKTRLPWNQSSIPISNTSSSSTANHYSATPSDVHQISEWTEVVKRKKAPQKQRIREAAKNAKVVVGTKGDSSLTASTPAKHLFLSQVSNDHGVNDIKSFMERNNVKLRGIRKTSKEEWMRASFKLSVEAADVEKVFAPGFWPHGICCRE